MPGELALIKAQEDYLFLNREVGLMRNRAMNVIMCYSLTHNNWAQVSALSKIATFTNISTAPASTRGWSHVTGLTGKENRSCFFSNLCHMACKLLLLFDVNV